MFLLDCDVALILTRAALSVRALQSEGVPGTPASAGVLPPSITTDPHAADSDTPGPPSPTLQHQRQHHLYPEDHPEEQAFSNVLFQNVLFQDAWPGHEDGSGQSDQEARHDDDMHGNDQHGDGCGSSSTSAVQGPIGTVHQTSGAPHPLHEEQPQNLEEVESDAPRGRIGGSYLCLVICKEPFEVNLRRKAEPLKGHPLHSQLPVHIELLISDQPGIVKRVCQSIYVHLSSPILLGWQPPDTVLSMKKADILLHLATTQSCCGFACNTQMHQGIAAATHCRHIDNGSPVLAHIYSPATATASNQVTPTSATTPPKATYRQLPASSSAALPVGRSTPLRAALEKLNDRGENGVISAAYGFDSPPQKAVLILHGASVASALLRERACHFASEFLYRLHCCKDKVNIYAILIVAACNAGTEVGSLN
eukprot:240698-Pelagomonas_calceolata.AAC.1